MESNKKLHEAEKNVMDGSLPSSLEEKVEYFRKLYADTHIKYCFESSARLAAETTVAELKAYIKQLEEELEGYRVEGAYQRGYKDYLQNDGRTNPYPEGTESHRLWYAGYEQR